MIHLIAVITAHPGQRGRVIDAFLENASMVRSEAGCIEYVATVDALKDRPLPENFGPETVVAIEKWADFASLKAHAQAPHMVAFGARIEGLVASKVIHLLTPVEVSSR